MLISILPSQVDKYWDIIKEALEEALPPIHKNTPEALNNILAELLAGNMICWVSYEQEEKTAKIYAIIVTKIVYDRVSREKSLLIYSLTTIGEGTPPQKLWLEGLGSLRKYCQVRGCSRIIAYSQVPSIAKITEAFGGDSSWRFISFDV